MARSPATTHTTEYRYGDFPELFWDAEPELPVDPANAVVLARILSRGSMRAIAGLLMIEIVSEHLDRVDVAPNVRSFWRRVVSLPARNATNERPAAVGTDETDDGRGR